MDDLQQTMHFNLKSDTALQVEDIISDVYRALVKKGYAPINQMVGYFISGDPTYITSHEGARSTITRLERDDILEEILRKYIEMLETKEKK